MDEIQILIVEDDECLQTALYKSVRMISPGLSVEWASTADQALAILRRKRIDIVISDYYLQDQVTTGIRIWERCRRISYKTQFLLMSGMATQEFVRMTERRGIILRFLPKPFGLREFQSAVSEMISATRKNQELNNGFQTLLKLA